MEIFIKRFSVDLSYFHKRQNEYEVPMRASKSMTWRVLYSTKMWALDFSSKNVLYWGRNEPE